MSLDQWYREIPVVTRTYITLAGLTTVACSFEVITPLSLYLNTKLIWEKGQVWRLVTNFLFFGVFGMDFVFHIFFLYRYSRSLEEGSFRRKTADFFYMLLFGAVLLTIFALVFSPANIHFLGSSLTFMLVYVWSKRNRDVQMRLLEVLDFTAPYLPWVLLGFSLLLHNNPVVDLMGIGAGHIYFFLEDVYPQLENGRKVLVTPRFIKVLFGDVQDVPDEAPNYAIPNYAVDPVQAPRDAGQAQGGAEAEGHAHGE